MIFHDYKHQASADSGTVATDLLDQHINSQGHFGERTSFPKIIKEKKIISPLSPYRTSQYSQNKNRKK
jgi:hypothetical protein